jgi:hypothetical protein
MLETMVAAQLMGTTTFWLVWTSAVKTTKPMSIRAKKREQKREMVGV